MRVRGTGVLSAVRWAAGEASGSGSDWVEPSRAESRRLAPVASRRVAVAVVVARRVGLAVERGGPSAAGGERAAQSGIMALVVERRLERAIAAASRAAMARREVGEWRRSGGGGRGQREAPLSAAEAEATVTVAVTVTVAWLRRCVRSWAWSPRRAWEAWRGRCGGEGRGAERVESSRSRGTKQAAAAKASQRNQSSMTEPIEVGRGRVAAGIAAIRFLFP